MNYPLIDDYRFDINQAFEENKIIDEPYVLRDGQLVLVPRYSPFFADSLTITTIDGQELVYGKDYRFFCIMAHLTGLCGGQKCVALIEILNKSVKSVLMDYHTVGSSTLFDSSLVQLINNAANDKRLIPFKNLKNRPAYYPPKLHFPSLVYDTVAFGDMVEMFNLWADSLDKLEDSVQIATIKHYAEMVTHFVVEKGDYLYDRIVRHINTYDAHGLTKVQAGLGNVTDDPIATLAEGLSERGDRTLTPALLNSLIALLGYRDDGLLEAGSLPVSNYGNNNFIPPLISGGLAGIGGENELAVFAMESNGEVISLKTHFDGLRRSVIYEVLDQFPSPASYTTGQAYTHPVLTAASYRPETIVVGGSTDIFMLGRYDTDDAYLVLSANTLNPIDHRLFKVSMTDVFARHGRYPVGIRVHNFGEWIYLFITTTGTFGRNRKYIYRLRATDMLAGAAVKFVSVKINYTDFNGLVFNNADYYDLCQVHQFDSALGYASYLYKYKASLANPTNGVYRSMQELSCPSVTSGKYAIKMMFYFYTYPGALTTSFGSAEVIYDFDPVSNTFTRTGRSSDPGILNNDVTNNVDQLNGSLIYRYLQGQSSQGMSLFANGSTAFTTSLASNATPYSYLTSTQGPGSVYGFISTVLESRYTGLTFRDQVAPIRSPLISSINQLFMGYDTEGEYYRAGARDNPSNKNIFYRKVTGGYEQRPEISNVFYPTVRSRPLSNDIYTLPNFDGVHFTSVTGMRSYLSSKGIDYGMTGFMLGHTLQTRPPHYNNNMGQPLTNPMDINCICRFTKNYSGNALTFNMTEESYYPAAMVSQIVDDIKDLNFDSTTTKYISILDLTGDFKDRFGDYPCVVELAYYHLETGTMRTSLALIRFTYGAVISGRKTALSYQILDTKKQTVNRSSGSIYINYDGQGAPRNTTIWVADGQLKMYHRTSVNTAVPGDTQQCGYRFSLTPNGNNFNDYTLSIMNNNQINGWNYIFDNPNLLQNANWNVGGGCALLGVDTVSGQRYILASLYPESNWSVIFSLTKEVNIGGKEYIPPTGIWYLGDVTSDPANHTFYVYLQLINEQLDYVISLDKKADSQTDFWIGTIKTNDTTIESIDSFNVFLLNGVRVSEDKRGGSIPATSGPITQSGQLLWIRPSEVIQD